MLLLCDVRFIRSLLTLAEDNDSNNQGYDDYTADNCSEDDDGILGDTTRTNWQVVLCTSIESRSYM